MLQQSMPGADRLLRPIGIVRSHIGDRKAMPAFGAPASVELYPEVSDGLLRAEKHSHFWIFAWLMARPEREVLQVTPRGVPPLSPNGLHGVFAVRSPARPNPIGLTAARLLNREGLRLDFDRLDFLDGTEVIDLKPYFVSRDLIFSASSAAIGTPRGIDELRESLSIQAARFTGASHPDIDLAVSILLRYRSEKLALGEPARWEITAPAHRPYFVDALIGMTRVSFTRGLTLWDRDQTRINGDVFDLSAKPLV